MKKNVIGFLCLWIYSVVSFALDSTTFTDWTNVGKYTTADKTIPVLNIKDFGGIADNNTDNAPILSKAILSLNGKAGVIQFQEGNYFFGKTLVIPSGITITGQGSDKTIFNFNLNGNGDAFSIQGKSTNITTNIISGTEKESKTIKVANATNFSINDFCTIKQNANALLNNDWAYNSFFQIVRITKISGNEISFSSPLHLNFPASNQVILTKLNPVTDVAIQDVKIKRMDATSAQASSLFFNYAVNCQVSGVELENSNYALITLQSAAFCTVNGNYMHYAFDYGSGGKGYGIVLQFGANDNLIVDNIAEHLRHAFLLQATANGNVVAYNYSFDPFWKQSFFPSGSSGDIVLHGNYPYSNLFEGNILQNLVIDDSHGVNGPFNTFFRNRMESYGIFMNANSGNTMNFIANEITGSGFLKGLYSIEGTHQEIANTIKGDKQSGSVVEKSLFLKNYYAQIGVPFTNNTWTNAAYQRNKLNKKTSMINLLKPAAELTTASETPTIRTTIVVSKKKKCVKKKTKKK